MEERGRGLVQFPVGGSRRCMEGSEGGRRGRGARLLL